MNSQVYLPSVLEMAAIIFGGMSGAVVAQRMGFDFVGVLVVAFSTAVGGGLIRDILLETPIVLLRSPTFQLFALTGAVFGLFFARAAAKARPVSEALDTLLLGVWVLLSCMKAQQVGLHWLSVIFIGTTAAVGGGILRDILCHQITSVMQPGYFYTIAAAASATTFVVTSSLGMPLLATQILVMCVATGLRVLSLKLGILSPTPYDLTRRRPTPVRRGQAEPTS